MSGWVAGAVVVGGIASAAISSSGAQSAAETQANAANNAQAISQKEFNTITQQENPYLQAGYGAQSQLNYLLGIGNPGQGMGGTTSTGSAPGYDPSSGYRIGAGGSISQIIPGGSGGGGTTPAPGSGTVGAFGAPGYVSNGANPYPPGSAGWAMYNQGGLNATPGGGGTGSPAVNQPANGAPNGGYSYNGPSTASSSTAGGYGSLLSPFTTDTFKQYSPAYQFQLQQGQQGTLNGDTSGEGALSGAAQKDLIGYNQNFANTSFNNAFNQYQTQQGNIYSRLAGIANLGQSAASNTAQSGTALAGQAAQSASNAGSALAAGQVGSSRAWSGAVGNLSSLAASSPNAWGGSSTPNVSDGFDGATVGG